jgi:hypothetical protein
VLRLTAQIVDVEARDCTVLHADVTVDDHRIDIVADAALDQDLDGIANRSVAQRLPASKSIIKISASAPVALAEITSARWLSTSK